MAAPPRVGAYASLAGFCRRRGLRLALELVDGTGRAIRAEPGARYASLRVRVLDRDRDVLVGRIQSAPGAEHLDELAHGCIEILRRKGVFT